jgi:hypothetical protein
MCVCVCVCVGVGFCDGCNMYGSVLLKPKYEIVEDVLKKRSM